MSTISIIGAGDMAGAIGGLAGRAGYTVEVMSRDAGKARALAERIGVCATVRTRRQPSRLSAATPSFASHHLKGSIACTSS
ncbi:MAG: NAD(P)-binding domain-containing protein [Luteibacter sp.]